VPRLGVCVDVWGTGSALLPNGAGDFEAGYSLTMSWENVEICRRANAAWHNRDLAAFEAEYAPDIQWRDLQHAPDAPAVVHGIEAVRRIWSDWLHAFPDLRADISEYIDEGETVICLTHWHGSGEASGVPVDNHSVDVYELQGGRIVRVTFGHRSRKEALEATAQSEPRSVS
jgi:ketosteroid isomerase-like protein